MCSNGFHCSEGAVDGGSTNVEQFGEVGDGVSSARSWSSIRRRSMSARTPSMRLTTSPSIGPSSSTGTTSFNLGLAWRNRGRCGRGLYDPGRSGLRKNRFDHCGRRRTAAGRLEVRSRRSGQPGVRVDGQGGRPLRGFVALMGAPHRADRPRASADGDQTILLATDSFGAQPRVHERSVQPAATVMTSPLGRCGCPVWRFIGNGNGSRG